MSIFIYTTLTGVIESVTRHIARGGSVLTGDEDFTRTANEKRSANVASSGRAIAGLKAGGESLLSGFASGLSGLVTRPVEEGRKAGALGFVKGIGLGAVGAG